MPTKPILPRHEPRCLGRGCKDRETCKRYERTKYENLSRSAIKGYSLAMTLADNDGVCRRMM